MRSRISTIYQPKRKKKKKKLPWKELDSVIDPSRQIEDREKEREYKEKCSKPTKILITIH